jgi:uncharacterized protein YpmB
MGWSRIGVISFIIQLIILLKNTSLIAMYQINKHYDNQENCAMRPESSKAGLAKVDKEAYFNIKSYLIDPNDDILDEDGNTSIHLISKQENLEEFSETLKNNP